MIRREAHAEESIGHLDRTAGGLSKACLPALFSLEGMNVPSKILENCIEKNFHVSRKAIHKSGLLRQAQDDTSRTVLRDGGAILR
jgi:hypothetical protein